MELINKITKILFSKLTIGIMFLTLQITSIFFTTTTSIQIKEGLEDIEIFTRKILKKLPFLKKRISADPNISESVSILITFIPKLFVLWQQIDNAWKNRTKKFNIKKISTLLVTFISLCFVQADKTEKSLQNRKSS